MKKIIPLILIILMILGCENFRADGNGRIKLELDRGIDSPTLLLIDSCEYIFWSTGLAHKGNCYFCKERRQKELKYIIEQLKEN